MRYFLNGSSALIVWSLLSLFGCEGKKVLAARNSLSGGGQTKYASSSYEADEQIEFFKLLFEGENFLTHWNELDAFRSGSVAPGRIPFQDSWYPHSATGTNQLGALSLYDQALNRGQSLASDWEAIHHKTTDVVKQGWFGHCNGTSAASTRYENPRHSVFRPQGCARGGNGCTEFSPQAIRALLTEISMNVAFKWIGGDLCKLKREELLAKQRTSYNVMDACDDINPGSFHLALVNYLGRMKQPLIHDKTSYDEIWNYPLISYSYQAQTLSESQAAQLAGSPDSSWVFNRQAQSWVKVDMTLSYRSFDSSYKGAGTTPPGASEPLSYILELDGEGKVIGGEWIGDSLLKAEHPDALWMAFEPRAPIDDDRLGNPHVDPVEVVKIWAESVDRDPANPFPLQGETSRVLNYPTNKDLTEWAAHANYVVILDGRRSGAAFIEKGRDTILRIQAAADELKSNTSIELLLNGFSVADEKIVEESADFRIRPRLGINTIALRWHTESTNPKLQATHLNREFRFYAM